ncbi:GIY-YIG nuclease family protein, partial [Paraburkholderia sp. J63]|uniref:GIY-YIG nuclease family protein n=1 Tax=Paraburkholderia sp. J63 TaxID=2805434 RepID=UPI002ABD42D5
MAGLPVTTFVRIRPDSLIERDAVGSESVVVGPPDFLAQLKPKVGIVVASWNPAMQLGCASRLGIVVGLGSTGVKVRWATTDATYRPNPTGRRYWVQQKPFFGFAADVAKRYMLAAEFVEKFPDAVIFDATRAPANKSLEVRPISSPTGGYVYLVRSQYGIKIGKSVNVKSRTRLFEV